MHRSLEAKSVLGVSIPAYFLNVLGMPQARSMREPAFMPDVSAAMRPLRITPGALERGAHALAVTVLTAQALSPLVASGLLVIVPSAVAFWRLFFPWARKLDQDTPLPLAQSVVGSLALLRATEEIVEFGVMHLWAMPFQLSSMILSRQNAYLASGASFAMGGVGFAWHEGISVKKVLHKFYNITLDEVAYTAALSLSNCVGKPHFGQCSQTMAKGTAKYLLTRETLEALPGLKPLASLYDEAGTTFKVTSPPLTLMTTEGFESSVRFLVKGVLMDLALNITGFLKPNATKRGSLSESILSKFQSQAFLNVLALLGHHYPHFQVQALFGMEAFILWDYFKAEDRTSLSEKVGTDSHPTGGLSPLIRDGNSTQVFLVLDEISRNELSNTMEGCVGERPHGRYKNGSCSLAEATLLRKFTHMKIEHRNKTWNKENDT